MLKTKWEQSSTYREFFTNVANVDCILLQLWLKQYVYGLWKNYNPHSYWMILKSDIYSWNNVETTIGKKHLKLEPVQSGGDDAFSMDDFLKLKKLLGKKI